MERDEKSELFPAEIAIPCSNGSTEQAVERKRIPKRPIPLVSAHSCISMRYDPSKPGKVTVVNPRSAASRHDYHRSNSVHRDALEKHTTRRYLSQSTDDIVCTDANSPRRKSKPTSRRKPVPLVPSQSSISMRLAPSRPGRVLVVNPASPNYIDENGAVSPLSDHGGSISSVAPFKGYPVELDNRSLKQKNDEDDASIRSLSRSKVKTRSLRRPFPLAYQRSSVSVQTAPSAIERVVVAKLEESVISPRTDHYLNKYTTEIDEESEKQHTHYSGDNLQKYHSHTPTRSHSKTGQYNQNCLPSDSSHFKEKVDSRLLQGDDKVVISSPASMSLHKQVVEYFRPADQMKSTRIRSKMVETRDDDSVADDIRECDRQLNSKCDESLRGIRTIQSDFEVEVRTHGRIDERDEEGFDDYSVTTPDIAPKASTCSSVSSTASGGTETKRLLRRMIPTKIKDKLTQHSSGIRSVFSAPERRLPKISEMMTHDDVHDTNRSTETTITVNPNVLEYVTSELTDANFSEDQSVFSIPVDYVAKKISEKRKGSIKMHGGEAPQPRNEKEMMFSRNLDGKEANRTDDQQSADSSKSSLNYYRALGHMLSPVTSDLSVKMSESFESRRVSNLNMVHETNSVASRSSFFSRSKQITPKSISGPVCKEGRSNFNSEKMSADLSTEKEDTIITIYDRNAQTRYNFLTRPRAQAFEENINVPEIQSDLSGSEYLEKVKSPDTIGSYSFTGYFPSPRLLTLRPAKAQFGLSFEAGDENSFSGLDRHRSERSRKAELAMLPSEDSGILDDTFPKPSLDYLKPQLDDSVVNPLIASFNSLRAQFGL